MWPTYKLEFKKNKNEFEIVQNARVPRHKSSVKFHLLHNYINALWNLYLRKIEILDRVTYEYYTFVAIVRWRHDLRNMCLLVIETNFNYTEKKSQVSHISIDSIVAGKHTTNR